MSFVNSFVNIVVKHFTQREEAHQHITKLSNHQILFPEHLIEKRLHILPALLIRDGIIGDGNIELLSVFGSLRIGEGVGGIGVSDKRIIRFHFIQVFCGSCSVLPR